MYYCARRKSLCEKNHGISKKKSVYSGNLAHRAKVKPLILKIAPGTKFVDVEFVQSNRLTKTKKLITIRTVKIKTKTNDLFNTVK